jgi:DNA-binding NtrC family response regulator
MTGPELHATLQGDYPGLKVLYMSGYTSNVIAQQGMLSEGMRYLQKPFAITEFMRTAEALLKP